MPGAIIEITSVTNGVGVVPAKSKGTLPSTLRNFWALRLVDHALILPGLGNSRLILDKPLTGDGDIAS